MASEATQKINPEIKIRALQNRVSPETEGVFNDSFWQGLDFVVNALDNVNARLYVDQRCVYFCKFFLKPCACLATFFSLSLSHPLAAKALLESGTLGPKCNTQMVIPNMTENYGASRDPPEKQAPMCTVHSFPHNIDHCLTWARSEFEGLLEKAPTEANLFLESPEKYIQAIRQNPDAAAREQVEKVADLLVLDSVSTFNDCVAWARLKFQDYFHNRIAQLVFTFPEDATTSTGSPFWSAPKRFPKALAFDPKDATMATLVQAGAILKAQVHGIPVPDFASVASKVAEAATKVHVDPFQPKKGVHIETDPKAGEKKELPTSDDDGAIEALIAK